MRFKKLISTILSAVMLFGNSLIPCLGVMEDFAAPALRIGLPALAGSLILSARIAYARTVRNAFIPPTQLQMFINTLSNDPSDEELEHFRSFETPFYPVSGPEQLNENHDLAQAIQQTLTDMTDTRMDYLENFVLTHPNSRWVLAAELNNGILLYKNGYFAKALRSFYKACIAGKGEKTSDKAAALADRALAEAVRMNCRVGRVEVAENLLNQLRARGPSGLAARYAENGIKAVWQMKNRPGKAFFCGPYALKSILKFQHSKEAESPIIEDAQSPKTGYSLDQVWQMSESLGMGLQMAKRSPGAPVLLPAVANWKLNHYAALVEEKNGLIHSIDPTFGNQTWLSEKALDEESSGYFLVPEGSLPAGWTAVSEDEASKVFGKGFVDGFGPWGPCGPDGGDGGPSGGPQLGGGGGVGGSSSGGGGGSCGFAGYGGPPSGMPKADIDMASASPTFADTPIGHNATIGPPVNVQVKYQASNIVTQPYANAGQNVACNWQGSVEYSYAVSNGTTPVVTGMTLYNPGGGQETIAAMGQPTQYSQSTFSSLGTLSGNFSGVDSALMRTAPDGSAEIYSKPTLFAGSQTIKYVLTQTIDPKGNVINLNYDNTNSLTSIADANGQITTVAYGDPNNPYGVTQVTDPLGRTTDMTYDNQGNLTSIRDEAGMTSSMAYNTFPTMNKQDIQIPALDQEGYNVVDNANNGTGVSDGGFSGNISGGASGATVPLSGDLIKSLTTPYGTTSFTYATYDSNGNQSVVITDPMQEQEMSVYTQSVTPARGGAQSSPNEGVGDQFMADRNTFFWSKKAMADNPGDPASAKVYHWLHTPEDQQSGVLESIQNPNESNIWYQYAGQTNGLVESNDEMAPLPSVVNRTVSNSGTQESQEYQYQYNSYGKVVGYTDPDGRAFTYTYAPNGQDLLQVQDSGGETLAQYTYDNNHNKLTYKDASGQTWGYSYNGAGKMTSMTAPMGETTQYNYDSNGNMISMIPPQSGGTVTYTYDSVGRKITQTDAAHGTLRYSYDNLDRVTQINYSDGTNETYQYTKMDLTAYKDRQNRTTIYTYDGDRHMTSVTDPKMQTTQFGWCSCGSLESMTDPSGNKTTWNRDYEGRVIQKIYPDGSTVSYNWDPNGSQLLSVQDANKNVASYSYDLDNELTKVSYSGPVSTPSVSFSYDETLPRLTSMSDGTGTTSYSYYAIGSTGGGHVETVTSPVGTTTANITYVYDNDGRTTNRAIDSNSESYGYTNDELVNVTNPLGSFGYTYDSTTTNLTQISYPNGQKTNMTYYQPSNPLGAGRLDTLTNTGAGSTSGQTLSAFSYSYTQAGDIASWTQQLDNTPADSHTYTMGYDRDSELTSATLTKGTTGFDGLTANKGVTFGYDASGNRTSEQTNTYSHNFGTNNLNQLTNITPNPIAIQGSTSSAASVFVNGQGVTEDTNNNFNTTIAPAGGSRTPLSIQAVASNGTQATQTNHLLNTQPYTYDANGNLTQDDKYSYTYDAENRLVQVNFLNSQPTTKPDTVQMAYDGVGRRISITELHGTTVITAKTFVWCNKDLCQERDVTGHTMTKQFFSQGEQINGTNYYYTKDHLGNVREMTDTNGVVHANYDYDAFGRQAKLSGDLDADFGYTGLYVNKTSGLSLTWFRVYDAEKGRWLNRDPLAERTGSNLYAYVRNDTLVLIDPWGLCTSTTPQPLPMPTPPNQPFGPPAPPRPFGPIGPVGTFGLDAAAQGAENGTGIPGIGPLLDMALQLSGLNKWDPGDVYLGLGFAILFGALGIEGWTAFLLGWAAVNFVDALWENAIEPETPDPNPSCR